MTETHIGSEEPGEEDVAHDVLAADEFALPAPDPVLHHHGPVDLPGDPTGNPEPHDVLAAEEFPMPASQRSLGESPLQRRGGYGRLVLEAAGGLSLVLTLRAIRRRRRR